MNCKLLIVVVATCSVLSFYIVSAADKLDMRPVSTKIIPLRKQLSDMARPIKRVAEGQNSEYYDYYYHEQEEPECPDYHFWHIRGLKCVPFDCPGGNQYRNQQTGECILSRYGNSEETKVRPSRFLNRMKAPSKYRLPFGLTLKG